MASYQDSVILKFDSPETGNAAVGRQIAVKQEGVLSNIFLDANLTITKPNPFVTDQDGFYQFYAADGVYNIEIGNPVERTLQIALGEVSDLVPGVTVLANSLPSSKFLERNNQLALVSEYPDLAGTPGYPISSEITGYILGSNVTRETATSQHFGFNNRVIYDENGVIYITNVGKTGATGSFIYSEDDGLTENYATTSNALNLLNLATNNTTLIVAVGRSGRVEVFDYASKSSIGNVTVGTSDITYIEHNSGIWTLITFEGNVYTSSNPSVTWTLDGTIDFGAITKTGIYAEKTNTGYIIYVNGADQLFHVPTLLGSPTATLTYTKVNLDISIGNGYDGNGRYMFNDGSDVYVSTNGGESFSQATATLFNPNNGSLYFAAGETWVLVTDNGEFYYTKDFGESFIKEIVTSFYYPWIYFNSSKDAILVPNGSSTRVVFNASTESGTKFIVSSLLSPNTTDKYYVKAR